MKKIFFVAKLRFALLAQLQNFNKIVKIFYLLFLLRLFSDFPSFQKIKKSSFEKASFVQLCCVELDADKPVCSAAKKEQMKSSQKMKFQFLLLALVAKLFKFEAVKSSQKFANVYA